MLVGRDRECEVLDGLVGGARSEGRSAVLVLRGEPGIGKTALLDYAGSSAAGLRVLRAAGVESEAELPYAGLHLLLRPLLDRPELVDAVPAVQARALRGALGLGPAVPDGFLVGLAVLSLLSEAGPLLCLVDDAQWLDRASAGVLVFAARRLAAEGVVMIFAAREGGLPGSGLPEQRLGGLDSAAAGALLRSLGRPGGYPLLAEAAGNPLALVELPAGPVGDRPLTDRLRAAFAGQVRGLSASAQAFLLIAALEETGDLPVLLAAAGSVTGSATGSATAALGEVEQAGLVRVGEDGVLAFRHPLVRTAVRGEAGAAERMGAHLALAAAGTEPDRRVWHLAMAATGPDETVAADLEQAAARAGRLRGHSAAARAYERSARLSTDPAARARRLTAAAEATAEAGDVARSAELAQRVDTEDPALAARLATVTGLAAFARGDLSEAWRTLVGGARRVAGSAPETAARMLVEAVHVGWYRDESEVEVALSELAALPLPPDSPLAAVTRLMELALEPILGRPARDIDPAAVLADARAVRDLPDRILAGALGMVIGHDAVTREIMTEIAATIRAEGRIGLLPTALFYLASADRHLGRLEEARSVLAEALDIARDTGQQRWVDQLAEVEAFLAASEGDQERCRALVDAALATAVTPAWDVPWTYAAVGLLDLGLGRTESALTRLQALDQGRARFHIVATRSTPDLVEAAVRTGRPGEAGPALAFLTQFAARIGRPWAAALVERCHALLAPDTEAEQHYTAALALHAQDPQRFDEARTRLLYGEWLRRMRRRTDARTELRRALEAFDQLAVTPWSARARTELQATGLPATTPAPGPLAALTPQEAQIVRLAAQGLSNKEIAAQLFLSPRTVGHHLYKAYPKLGILSRNELPALLTR